MIEANELTGEAFREVHALFDAWEKPSAKWPEGTTFEGPTRARYGSRVIVARLPNGHIYELLYPDGASEDPRETPPVLWSIWIGDTSGLVFAHPRIANMWCGLSDPIKSTDEAKAEVWHGKGLGLERSYPIGRLSRRLREQTHTVHDGWGYE